MITNWFKEELVELHISGMVCSVHNQGEKKERRRRKERRRKQGTEQESWKNKNPVRERTHWCFTGQGIVAASIQKKTSLPKGSYPINILITQDKTHLYENLSTTKIHK